MHRTRILSATLALAAAAALTLALATPVTVAEDGVQKFEGTYDWNYGGKDSLAAEFTPDGEDSWTVSFKFHWNDGDYDWSGTAEGSLEDGTSVSGTATSGDRTWTWEAEIADGVMSGSHIETTGGGNSATGTFEISR